MFINSVQIKSIEASGTVEIPTWIFSQLYKMKIPEKKKKMLDLIFILDRQSKNEVQKKKISPNCPTLECAKTASVTTNIIKPKSATASICDLFFIQSSPNIILLILLKDHMVNFKQHTQTDFPQNESAYDFLFCLYTSLR